MCTFASPAWAAEAFGVEDFESSLENQDGSPATQAGSHPYALTTTIMFNHKILREEEREEENAKGEEVFTGEPEVYVSINDDPRDLEINFPAGLVVNPSATNVKCTEAQLEERPRVGGGCPDASAVGFIAIYGGDGFGESAKAAVYNMVPPSGIPAELGINLGGVGFVAHIVGSVQSSKNYEFSGNVSEIIQKIPIYGVKLTLWGNPTDSSHDAQRGICAASGMISKAIEREFFEKENIEQGKIAKEYRFDCPVEESDTPLLTMPGVCTGKALETTMSVNSWQEPEGIEPLPATSPPVTGCENLDFSPSLDVKPAPEAATVESPTGLNVDLKIPREESAKGLAGADPERMVVTLPPGMAISLSAANGLGACTSSEIELHNENPSSCPNSSKLGEAEVLTPLLEQPLKGAVYLAQPETFEGSLIGLYVVVEGGGVLIKLGGKATLDPNTGQIALAFDNIPQLPLSEIKLDLFGGPRAALLTPSECGTYAAISQLTPWSGNAPAEPSSEFTIGSSCGQNFNPSFTAGTTDSQAGAFSPFSITFSRQDGEQRLSSVRVVAPPGLLGVLGSAKQCPEPQASAGECGPESEIGEATLALGPGVDPFWVKGGKIYLTGPTSRQGLDPWGAPFGLSLVIPAVAGPFNLGQVVVRARVEVDSHTAQVVIASEQLPSILKGIPLDIRTVNMTIDRAGFTFNPTSCSPLTVTGTLSSAGGASAAVSSPFEAVNCAKLPFKPKFTASTQARTSRAHGASLEVKIASGPGQANTGKVRVILPSQLPARLTTLQKACTDMVFNADPASCPAASVVGAATAVTPVLAHPLTGPVYLVSHGAAFPDLVVVLQGEGIVVYLDGNLNIKQGLTSATFNSIPDIPIGMFEIVFPEGSHSILGMNIPAEAKGSMCGQPLTMPTALTGQNGARVTQTTKVAVTGCPKKAKAKAGKDGKKKRRGG
jgi:hypothetical protein